MVYRFNGRRHALPVLILSGLALLSSHALAENRTFQREDVFGLEWASDPQISPDGRRVAYVRKSMDIMSDVRERRIWLVDDNAANHLPLTGNDKNESNPRWSPDGTRIAYTSRGQHGAEIFVHWLASGKSVRVTQLPESPSGLSWSPDGQHIAFSMLVAEKPPVLVKPPPKPEGAEWPDAARVTTRLVYERDGRGRLKPGFNHYFVVPYIGGTPRQVTQGNFHHRGTPVWTPDGSALVFSANRNPDWENKFVNSEIYRLDLADGTIQALTDRDGPDHGPAVSPDGRQIAWLSFADKVQAYQIRQIHVMDLNGDNKKVVATELDRSVTRVVWAADGKGLFFQYANHGDGKIGYTSLAGQVRVIANQLGGEAMARPYGGGSFSISKRDRIAFSYSTPYDPAAVAVTNGRRTSDPEVLTDLNGDLLGHRRLGKVEEIWYTSSIDGLKLQGWIVTPPDYDAAKTYPLLVENHGGPISHYGPHFSPEMQLYAAAGYVVFYPNPRGSTSYGEDFANKLYHNYPGEDYQDVMDGVDALIARGVAHEDRLYVTGGSAGGIMTAWIIGKNNRFRAAAVIKPVMNWISKTLTADNYFMYADYRYPGQPWENIETYMKFSPISLVGNIQTPTLVMVGTADLRTPLSESKQLYSALKIRGIDTALVEIPDAAHLISRRPSQMVSKIDHILAWMAKHTPPSPYQRKEQRKDR